jgi:valyl-tRNA synthetase
MLSSEGRLPKTYNPADYEDAIYERWEKSGFFNPDKLDLPKNAKSYTIVLPPPNITDRLHMGHTAMLSIEDLLIRYHRLKGERALWIPGTDHAAIATQNVVEKRLLKEENKTRHDLGREKFLERVWRFLRETQNTILKQTRKMGASLDWSRQAFTLDEPRAKAVKKLFVDMYKEGAIYRGQRVVNWCPRCQSTLADDEVEYKEEKGKLYWLKYGPFVLATSRPETKLGDTAVAVYPGDKRYEKMVGKKYPIPGVLGEFEITVVADRAVDPKFGSGAIKVTPAHDFTDYEIAQRHGLPMKQVIDERGRMMANTGKYAGMTTGEAREAILKDMEKMGLIDHIEDGYLHNIALCYRCGTQIEPLPSKQWFVAVDKKLKRLGNKSLKEKAIKAARDGKIEFIPERFKKRYLDWMNNLHDWCVSRQIWFGHRIPVYYRKQEMTNDQFPITNQIPNPKSQESNLIRITYFVHGTTTDNEQGRCTGWHDGELSNLGKKQNLELRATLKKRGDKYDTVFTSDLKRAKESAKVVFAGAKIIADKRLRECNYGDLNGESEKRFKDEKYHINNPHPNGESYQDVEKRVRQFLMEIKEKYAGKKIAIMAHKVPQLALEVVLNGKTWEQALAEDWRKKKAWQPGWRYEVKDKSADSEEIYVGLEAPTGEGWQQDEDTLDTWFSSGTWTFSTLGWPDNYAKGKKAGDLAKFHPTQVLETGYEIITLWVSRMIIMSFFALNEIPFEKVYLHGMILDKAGKKMSKSKGNGVDPLDVIARYGADAARMFTIMGNTPGNDTRYFEEKVQGARNLVNKLWNVARYIITNYESGIMNQESGIRNRLKTQNLTLADRWILGKMGELVKQVTKDLNNYQFSQASEKLRNFTWDDLADWYLEASKFENNQEKNDILVLILENLLKLWHPFMPFVTEATWQEMGKKNFLMVERWPFFAPLSGATAGQPKTSPPLSSKGGGSAFELIKDIIIAIRNARAENKIEPAQKIKTTIYAGAKKELVESQAGLIKGLRTGVGELAIMAKGEKISGAISVIVGGMEIYLLAEIDKAKETARLEKEIAGLEKFIQAAEGKLANKEFVGKAPAAVVEKEKIKLGDWQNELKKFKKRLEDLK